MLIERYWYAASYS